MNELMYQQGGTLYLDENLPFPPVSATFTLRSFGDLVLSAYDEELDDIEAQAATVDALTLTMSASAKGAKLFQPTLTEGAIGDITNGSYRFLVERGGRRQYFRISEYDVTGDNITSFRIDGGLDFPISNGDKIYGLRISYPVDFSTSVSTFVGRLKGTWTVTLSNASVIKVTKVYDVVRQVLVKQASWADVVARRPDVDLQTAEIRDKESLVNVAWDDMVTKLYNMGIRHNLVIPEYSTVLRDATVMQCLYNLTMHTGISPPAIFDNQGDNYLDFLRREISTVLGGFIMPIDDNEDGIIAAKESGSTRRAVWLRGATFNRGVKE